MSHFLFFIYAKGLNLNNDVSNESSIETSKVHHILELFFTSSLQSKSINRVTVLPGFILTMFFFFFFMRAKPHLVFVEDALVQTKFGLLPGIALIHIRKKSKKQTNKQAMGFDGRGYQALAFLIDYCATYPRSIQKQTLAYMVSLEMKQDGTGRIGLLLTH